MLFFSPADVFHLLCLTEFHPEHFLCQENHADNRSSPQTAAAPSPHIHRPIDLEVPSAWGGSVNFILSPQMGSEFGSLSYWMSLWIFDQWPSPTTSRDLGSILGLQVMVLQMKMALPPPGHLTISTLNSCFYIFITQHQPNIYLF